MTSTQKAFLVELGAVAALFLCTVATLRHCLRDGLTQSSCAFAVVLYPYAGLLVAGIAHRVSPGALYRRHGPRIYLPYGICSAAAVLLSIQALETHGVRLEVLLGALACISSLSLISVVAGCEPPLRTPHQQRKEAP